MLILVASVGGSVAPIASAIAAKRPDHVLFVASEPRGDRPGSAGEVPSILQKAQRPKQAHDILRLEDPDDPEAAFLALRGEVERLRGKHPSACFLFDYTGGTKSMTSAVFQCALATPGAELQLMTGRREDLQGVTPRTERPVEIRVGWLLAERQEARLREAWRRFYRGDGFSLEEQRLLVAHTDAWEEGHTPAPAPLLVELGLASAEADLQRRARAALSRGLKTARGDVFWRAGLVRLSMRAPRPLVR